jgi:hypothetical protein
LFLSPFLNAGQTLAYLQSSGILPVLSDKLNSYYGINCNAFHWIKDFLTDRTQTVILEGETSNKIPVTSGVPQVTVLGPILFLIFINDLAEYIQHSTLRLFADDSIIYKQIKNKEDAIKLQQDLDAAGKWEQDWLMRGAQFKSDIISVTELVLWYLLLT